MEKNCIPCSVEVAAVEFDSVQAVADAAGVPADKVKEFNIREEDQKIIMALIAECAKDFAPFIMKDPRVWFDFEEAVGHIFEHFSFTPTEEQRR